jgi:hypothetical protein
VNAANGPIIVPLNRDISRIARMSALERAKKLSWLRGEQEEEPVYGERRAATKKLTRRSSRLLLGGVRSGPRRETA